MKKKILSHTSVMIILTVILTFIAASFVMYDKYNSTMKKGVRDEAEYVKVGIEEVGEAYLSGNVGKTTDTRITLTDSEGNVLYDNEAEASKQPSGICPGYEKWTGRNRSLFGNPVAPDLLLCSKAE